MSEKGGIRVQELHLRATLEEYVRYLPYHAMAPMQRICKACIKASALETDPDRQPEGGTYGRKDCTYAPED